ncbi:MULTISPECIES: hypothetical protein [unclassified Bradyrhizobium]|uniref:hypothetical protein n=1 Tax=unclassified Bradyrhizobium TaxID=2631580 RepID=UPI00247A1846|nr:MULTISPECIES: hypothetical protein [unclassified Bradyrhizobium]WGS19613.1 hypothetical protein MTX22_35490 [Bradyrhizobium sp. ISRA463]WGS26455.1 hypothetical protein MTX19_32955 [Bradyrhizobium sp. ISRA464]
MATFGWTRVKKPSEDAAFDFGGLTDPLAFLAALDKAVPRYLDLVDNGALVYPACKRKAVDTNGDGRAIWEHTRLEAMRYLPMVPRQDAPLLVDPARQADMIDAFLRQRPHENTIIDFTGTPIEDYGIAIYAALNWLNHCGALSGADPQKFSGTLRSFRRVMVVARQWWAIEGAAERCRQMLQGGKRPPLVFFLLWAECTNLAREIAIAVTPDDGALRLKSAQDPEDLAP